MFKNILSIIILSLLLAGCSNASKYEDKKVAEINSMNAETVVSKFPDFSYTSKDGDYTKGMGGIVVSPKGYYFNVLKSNKTGGVAPWYFYNVDTGKVSILCSDPTCEHTDKETCEAYFTNQIKSPKDGSNVSYQMQLGFYNNRLYSVVYGEKGVQMVTFDEMGNDKIVQCTVEEDPSWVSDSFFVYDNVLYVSLFRYNEEEENIQEIDRLLAVNLSDNSKKVICENIYPIVLPSHMKLTFNINMKAKSFYVNNGKIYISMSKIRQNNNLFSRVILEYNPSNGNLNQVLDFDDLIQEKSKTAYLSDIGMTDKDIYFLFKDDGEYDEETGFITNSDPLAVSYVYKYNIDSGECVLLDIEPAPLPGRKIFIDDKYIYDCHIILEDDNVSTTALCIYDVDSLVKIAEYNIFDDKNTNGMSLLGLDERCIFLLKDGLMPSGKFGNSVVVFDLRQISEDFSKWETLIENEY